MTSRLNTLSKICVAVKFDDASKRAIKVAEQLCLRTGASMHLVHVCENVLASNFNSMTGIVPLPIELLQATQEGIEQIADSHIRELAKTVPSSIEVSTKVATGLIGKPADLIEAEAVAQNCSLIIVGTAPTSHRFIPRGFSCALTLMSHSKLPVMAVNQTQKSDLKADRLQMLIADDLKTATLPAVTSACRLAFGLTKTDIHHIHINGVDLGTLEASLTTAIATSHSHPESMISANEIFSVLVKNLEKCLQARTVDMNAASELAACQYRSYVVTESSVGDGLQKMVDKINPDLIVFGRHRRLHHKPFGIGQMPHYAMLNLQCPVVVFPSDEA